MHLSFHILMGLFFLIIFLFCASQFSVHSYLPGHSTKKLISNMEDFKAPRKVILVIVDSLRYDYVTKFPFISTTLAKYPQNSFISQCRVGNPTMTTQRVQSLMTGSELFSSASIFKTFFASKVSIDNIIHQINSQNKTSILMGDDTWAKLFDFTEAKTCSNTYNVYDLDSCDSFIYQFMIQSMRQQQSFDFMVSHFLSLDHVGHSLSTIHSEIMDAKIKKISAFMERVTNAMDNDTILFLTGDHGMRDDGNHGGSSQSEIETFLFGFNKQVPFKITDKSQMVSQPDLTATIALYLNVSLPLNTFGIPIIQALPRDSFLTHQLKSELFSNLLSHFTQMIEYYKAKILISSVKYQQILSNNEDTQSISDELQQYMKNLQFLKYSAPNESLNMGLLASLTIVSIIITFVLLDITNFRLLFKNNGLLALILWSNKALISLSLFAAYFSWYLIRNLSNFLSIISIISCTLFATSKLFCKKQNSEIQILLFLLSLFALAQVQPAKTNEYSSNFIQIHFLHQIAKNLIFKTLLMTFFVFKIVYDFQMDLFIKHREFYQILMLLNYLNFLLSSCFNYKAYYLRVIIFILAIFSCYYNTLSSTNSSNRPRKISFLSMIAVMLGQNAPFLILICILVSKVKLQPLFLGFVAEAIWWLMGNRFEYSGVDVVKSYIFSSEYHPMLNGTCLLFILISPHLSLFVLSMLEQNDCLQVQQHARCEQIDEKEQLQNKQNSYKAYSKESRKVLFGSSSLQFIIVPLLGLLSSAWNVDHNNSKILFTIVYIPMFMFCLIKVLLIYLILAFFQISSNLRKVKEKQYL